MRIPLESAPAAAGAGQRFLRPRLPPKGRRSKPRTGRPPEPTEAAAITHEIPGVVGTAQAGPSLQQRVGGRAAAPQSGLAHHGLLRAALPPASCARLLSFPDALLAALQWGPGNRTPRSQGLDWVLQASTGEPHRRQAREDEVGAALHCARGPKAGTGLGGLEVGWGRGRGKESGRATSRAERSSLAPRSHGPQSSWPQSRVPGGVWSSSETRTRHGRSEASLLSTCTPSWHPRVSPRESRLSYQCRSCCWGRCRRQRRSRGPRAQKTETRGRAVLGVHEAALGSGDKPGAQNGDNHCRVCRAHL